jgi:NAD(P)-dependent dehydrogenase (short-subunit alcohol dehydrogenase family)
MTAQRRGVAWVTGASRGIGANTALELARAGYDVALTSRGQDALDVVAERVRGAGREALAVTSDLTDRASIAAFADAAMERFGRCDVLCNIGVYQGEAGRLVATLLLDTSMDELQRSLEADVVTPAYLCQRVIPSMRANGGGVIVNMSSSSVFLALPGPANASGWSLAYAASKAGIDQFARILNVEHGADGIRAFNVEPGFVSEGEKLAEKVAKYPGVPVCPPEAIGPAIAWLAWSPEAAELLDQRINLPGITQARGLLPDWDGPGTVYVASTASDRSQGG